MRVIILAAAAAAVAAFSVSDLPAPDFPTMTQHGLGMKLDAYAAADPARKQIVRSLFPAAETLLFYAAVDPEGSYAKQCYNIADHAEGATGAACRSAAVLGANTITHVMRGVCTDRFRSEKARRACEAGLTILSAAPQWYGLDVDVSLLMYIEFLLLVLTIYLIEVKTLIRNQIALALCILARCAYAKFNSWCRGVWLHAPDRAALLAFLATSKATIVGSTTNLFATACPGLACTGEVAACFLAVGMYGARMKNGKPVPAVQATVFRASRTDLCSGARGRFHTVAAQSWYLFVLVLHCGLFLPTVGLMAIRYAFGAVLSRCLHNHLFGLHATSRESATWYGISFAYVRLETADYNLLFAKLRGPHHCLDLQDPEVLALMAAAARNGQMAGEVEYLKLLFTSEDNYYFEKSW